MSNDNQGLKVIETPLSGVLILEPKAFEDERGFLLESYNQRSMQAVGIDAAFVQDNHAYSQRNVLRGLHYQVNCSQGKLVRVVTGDIFDVAVDLRRASATFGKWFGSQLTEENRRMMWIPPGFAHGFQVCSEDAHVLYKVTDFYVPRQERTIAWDDAELAIKWSLHEQPIVSAKDRQGIPFRDAETFP